MTAVCVALWQVRACSSLISQLRGFGVVLRRYRWVRSALDVESSPGVFYFWRIIFDNTLDKQNLYVCTILFQGTFCVTQIVLDCRWRGCGPKWWMRACAVLCPWLSPSNICYLFPCLPSSVMQPLTTLSWWTWYNWLPGPAQGLATSSLPHLPPLAVSVHICPSQFLHW